MKLSVTSSLFHHLHIWHFHHQHQFPHYCHQLWRCYHAYGTMEYFEGWKWNFILHRKCQWDHQDHKDCVHHIWHHVEDVIIGGRWRSALQKLLRLHLARPWAWGRSIIIMSIVNYDGDFENQNVSNPLFSVCELHFWMDPQFRMVHTTLQLNGIKLINLSSVWLQCIKTRKKNLFFLLLEKKTIFLKIILKISSH